MITKSITIMKE